MAPDRRTERVQRILDDLAAQAGLDRLRAAVFVHRLATAGVTPGAAIGVSAFAADLLDDRELRATLAHEIGHIVLGTADPENPHGSPQAEFGADAYAVRLTGDPEALESALRRLARFNEQKESVSAGGRGQSHPSVSRRIRKIRQTARAIQGHGQAAIGYGRGGL